MYENFIIYEYFLYILIKMHIISKLFIITSDYINIYYKFNCEIIKPGVIWKCKSREIFLVSQLHKFILYKSINIFMLMLFYFIKYEGKIWKFNKDSTLLHEKIIKI